jgi:hypothetical protein
MAATDNFGFQQLHDGRFACAPQAVKGNRKRRLDMFSDQLVKAFDKLAFLVQQVGLKDWFHRAARGLRAYLCVAIFHSPFIFLWNDYALQDSGDEFVVFVFSGCLKKVRLFLRNDKYWL